MSTTAPERKAVKYLSSVVSSVSSVVSVIPHVVVLRAARLAEHHRRVTATGRRWRMATWIPAVVAVLVALVAVASFFRSATAGRVLVAITDNPMTAVGTLLAVFAAVALMVGSANSTTALRRDVGGVRSDVNERIDGVRSDVNERIDTTNERIDTTNERIDTTNERIDAGFAQITQEIRALRPPSQDADQ